MTEPRFVFDTNVIVSALLIKQSTARQAFDRARSNGKLLFSLLTFTELDEVLGRDKFDRYLSKQERLAFIAQLAFDALLIEIIVPPITECRDPKDNKFLEVAVSGAATCIVTLYNG